jgi:hypothetical protein
LKIFQLFSIVFDSFEEKKSQNYGLFTVAAAAPTTATTGANHRGTNHLFSRRTANLSMSLKQIQMPCPRLQGSHPCYLTHQNPRRKGNI